MDWSTVFDVGWYVIGALFVVTETGALFMDKREHTSDKNHNGVNDDGFTLSAHTRKWFRVDTAHGRTAFLVAFMIFSGSFLLHINSGGWTG
jgi:hypothetical protein